uniref:Uncharacterized protein n=1 Tax=Octopus bimaculoides TaxID=37653 RepID=A0A0L8G0I9_OCTBM
MLSLILLYTYFYCIARLHGCHKTASSSHILQSQLIISHSEKCSHTNQPVTYMSHSKLSLH